MAAKYGGKLTKAVLEPYKFLEIVRARFSRILSKCHDGTP